MIDYRLVILLLLACSFAVSTYQLDVEKRQFVPEMRIGGTFEQLSVRDPFNLPVESCSGVSSLPSRSQVL